MTIRSSLFIALFLIAPACMTAQSFRGEEPLAVERIEQLRKVRMIEALDLSEHTVNIHVKNILNKLGVSGRTEAVTVALRKGILQLD